MKKIEITQLIEAGAHFGHLTRRWNPSMKNYIFMERKGMHIMDRKQTQCLLYKSCDISAIFVASGIKVLFVGTTA